MKMFFILAAALSTLGIVVGAIAVNGKSRPIVPLGQEESTYEYLDQIKEAAEQRKADGNVPSAACGEPTFHFGIMDPLTVGEHTFYIENKGKAPLQIQGGPSSCKCTLSDLESATITPGEKYPVTLTWNSGHSKSKFRQVAVVRTTDILNEEIRLTVMGDVRSVLAALPPTVALNRLIPESQTSAQFVLYSQIWEKMDVVRIQSTNEHITGSLSNRPFEGGIARNDEIANATSGLVIDVNYDGHAPQGPLGGQLRVHVRPPDGWQQAALDQSASDDLVGAKVVQTDASQTDESISPPAIVFPTQDDGTIICEIPFQGTVIRRISLYGKQIGPDGIVDLGKLHPNQTRDANWIIVGRIRGDLQPSDVVARISGIPGAVATVDEFKADEAKNSFRVAIRLTESLEPAIFTKAQAGTLRLEFPGMPEDEADLELPVKLSVVKY